MTLNGKQSSHKYEVPQTKMLKFFKFETRNKLKFSFGFISEQNISYCILSLVLMVINNYFEESEYYVKKKEWKKGDLVNC